MIENEDQARAFCAERVDNAAFQNLEALVQRLRHENERQNLVAKTSLTEVWRRHIADSLQLLQHVPRGTGEWLDLGSGGGFPGLVVAIANADRPLVLVESRKLRVEWLRRRLLYRPERLRPWGNFSRNRRAFPHPTHIGSCRKAARQVRSFRSNLLR
jgi:16S rRNA (guanine527-N7)-methyltransferase